MLRSWPSQIPTLWKPVFNNCCRICCTNMRSCIPSSCACQKINCDIGNYSQRFTVFFPYAISRACLERSSIWCYVCSIAGRLRTALEDRTYSPLLQCCLTATFFTLIVVFEITFYLGHSKYYVWWWWWWWWWWYCNLVHTSATGCQLMSLLQIHCQPFVDY